MKRILSLLAVVLVIGCTTSQERIAYNTLATVGHTVDATYKGYLDLVVSGQLSTNSMPVINQYYVEFQNVFSEAVVLFDGNRDLIAPQSVITSANKLVQQVKFAKEGAR